jgi:hypothetical protein
MGGLWCMKALEPRKVDGNVAIVSLSIQTYVC